MIVTSRKKRHCTCQKNKRGRYPKLLGAAYCAPMTTYFGLVCSKCEAWVTDTGRVRHL